MSATSTNSITISYEDPSFKSLAPKKIILSYLSKITDALSLSNVEFSVSFITESSMRILNRDYRGIDDSTDILSFAAEDQDPSCNFITPSRRKRQLGDILICPAVLSRNAIAFSVPQAEELGRLLIHGVLHLSGLDHKTNDQTTEPMLIKQEQLLSQLSAPIIPH